MQTPSDKQLAVYNAVQFGKENVCVQATAGGGKTTTILQCLNKVPRSSSIIFLSFANAIVDELKEKVPAHVTASTLHSLGFGILRKSVPRTHKFKVDEDKYYKLALVHINPERKRLEKKDFKFCFIVQSICSYARMTLTPFTFDALLQMAAYYSIDVDESAVKLAMVLLSKSHQVSHVIDFTDMLYLAVVNPHIVTYQYDYVFLDEAQDMNACQRALIELLLMPKTGRLIAVGDRNQSIYSFSGADINSFKYIQDRPNTVTLPLSVTYRCAKEVVKKAQEIYPNDIEAFDGNIAGEVRDGSISEIEEGDMILSRTTKPLVALFFKLLDNEIKAKVIGKDIETGLINLAEPCDSQTKEGFVNSLHEKAHLLEEELRSFGFQNILDHPRVISLMEKTQVLMLILSKVSEASDIVPKIKEIFNEKRVGARLMTIHRSKGLENNRVFIIRRYNDQPLMPSKYASKDWEVVQENNLMFVAYTRAKKELIFVNLDD